MAEIVVTGRVAGKNGSCHASPRFRSDPTVSPVCLHADDGQGCATATGGNGPAWRGWHSPAYSFRALRVSDFESVGISFAACPQDETSKKTPETDTIFSHLKHVHTHAASEPETLRISLDTKAKVKIAEFSRGGVSRGAEVVRAADHDMHPDAILAPAGILEMESNQFNLIFGTSRDTSDFVADALELW
ncbi:MAG: hypothetical protein HUU20_15005 [Pirellulales bacterium]|nr:hypothetical protein [Pirellulales bacterium]